MSFYKRAASLFLTIAVLLAFALCGCNGGCNGGGQGGNGKAEKGKDGLSVVFIDVGEGDSAFVKFPDGKTLLVDCGEADGKGRNYNKIEKVLTEYSVVKLDYLLLTHADSDHTGNAERLIKKFAPNTAFMPFALYAESFPFLKRACDALKETGGKVEYSEKFKGFSGENYKATFLSPRPLDFLDSEYDAFNKTADPTEKARNDISAILFVEYNGVRFLFAGDAGCAPQLNVLRDVQSGLLAQAGVSLQNIDFFKVPHHGAADSVCLTFWEYLKPKNAVFSVSSDNLYGHPSDRALKTLDKLNPDYTLFRTDTDGNVTVFVGNDAYSVTASEKQKVTPLNSAV